MRALCVLVCMTIFSPGWAVEDDPCDNVAFDLFGFPDEKYDKTLHDGLYDIYESYDTLSTKYMPKSNDDTDALLNYIPRVGILFDQITDFFKLINTELRSFPHTKEFFDATWRNLYRLDRASKSDYNKIVKNIYETLNKKMGELSRIEIVDRASYRDNYAPLFIALSLAIAAFEPIAANSMPIETKKRMLPCQVYDLMIEYRSAAVDHRMEILRLLPISARNSIKNVPYNGDGYTTTGDKSLNCKSDSTLKANATRDSCVNYHSTSSYCNLNADCRIRCTQYIRQKLEEMFPAHELDQACQRECPEEDLSACSRTPEQTGWVEDHCDGIPIIIFESSGEALSNKYQNGLNKIERFYNDKIFPLVPHSNDDTAGTLEYIPHVGQFFGEIFNFLNEAYGKDFHGNELIDTSSKELNTLEDSNPNYYNIVNNIYEKLQQRINDLSKIPPAERDIYTPPFIALSLAIAAFEPIVANIRPDDTKKFKLPCQAYELMIDYRSSLAAKRVRALRIWQAAASTRENFLARTAPYNPDGYNTTSDSSLNCKSDSTSKDTFDCVNPDDTVPYCNSNLDCRIGCALHIRHKVEEIFFARHLEKACQRECSREKISACLKPRDPLSERNPFKDLKPNIFSGSGNVEDIYYNQLINVQKEFYDKFVSTGMGDLKDVTDIAALVTSIVPFVGAVFSAFSSILGIVLRDDDWRSVIMQFIEEKDDFDAVEKGVRDISLDLKDVTEKFRFLNEPFGRSHIYDINKSLKRVIEEYSDPKAIYKKYPLMTAPLLILASLSVAGFQPVVAEPENMAKETKDTALSCQAHDLLVDFRTLAVDARIDKLELSWDERERIKKAPLDPTEFYYDNENDYDYCKNDATSKDCLGDDFGKTYCNKSPECRLRFAKYVRQKVEERFPIDHLNQACKKLWPDREKSGQGYVTVKFKRILSKVLRSGKSCDYWTIYAFRPCSPIVSLSINNTDYYTGIYKSNVVELTTYKMITSALVPNNTKVSIEVRQSGGHKDGELIIKDERVVGRFLKESAVRAESVAHYSDRSFREVNRIVTAVFWRDIYNYMDCSPEIQNVQKHRKRCRKVDNIGYYIPGAN